MKRCWPVTVFARWLLTGSGGLSVAAVLALGSVSADAAPRSPLEGAPYVILEPVPDIRRQTRPGEVFDTLEAAGYREFGPMAQRGRLYSLRAVNPNGELVALEISIATGQIERELILSESAPLEPRFRRPLQPAPPQSAPPAPPPATTERDPLVIY